MGLMQPPARARLEGAAGQDANQNEESRGPPAMVRLEGSASQDAGEDVRSATAATRAVVLSGLEVSGEGRVDFACDSTEGDG
jgi:hypothetical protein